MVEIGCNENKVSAGELKALTDFYDATSGPNWRVNSNWLKGDPCLNKWYGVGCNVWGQVISLHFFENSLNAIA